MRADFPRKTRGIVFQQTDVAIPRDKIDALSLEGFDFDKLLGDGLL
jgi:hypothetical protein